MAFAAREADELVLAAFAQLGCLGPPPGSARGGVGALDGAALVQCVGAALRALGSADAATELAGSAASRMRTCTELGERLRAAGFPGDCEATTLLYGAEGPAREILSWLADAMSQMREGDKASPRLECAAALRHGHATHQQRRRQHHPPAQPLRKARHGAGDDLVAACLAAFTAQTWTVVDAQPALPAKAAAARGGLRTFPLSSAYDAEHYRLPTRQLGKTHWRSVGPSLLEQQLQARLEAAAAARPPSSSLPQSPSPATALSPALAAALGRGLHAAEMAADRERADEKSLSGLLTAHGRASAPWRQQPGQHGQQRDLHQGSPLRDQPGSSSALERFAGFSADAPSDAEAALLVASPLQPSSGLAQQRQHQQQHQQEQQQQQLAQQQEQQQQQQQVYHHQQQAVKVAREDARRSEAAAVTARARQRAAAEATAAALSRKSELEMEFRVAQRVLGVVERAREEGLAAGEAERRLEALVTEAVARQAALRAEWEAHRTALESRLAMIEAASVGRREQAAQRLAQAARLRDEARATVARVVAREERVAALEAARLRLPVNIDRSHYTSRIVDIIKQVRRQGDEVARAIKDVRRVQHDINTVSERLRRTEAVAEELVFSISDEALEAGATQAYRCLHDMRVLFDELIEAARETGRSANAARELASRRDGLRARVSDNNLERLLEDLAGLKSDNAALMKRAASQLRPAVSGEKARSFED
jgi:hypothetical protein